MNVQQRVRQFIAESFYIAQTEAIADDESLISNGYVDSTGMLEVIAFLENTYGISVGDRDITPANLETLGNIARYVERKLAEAKA